MFRPALHGAAPTDACVCFVCHDGRILAEHRNGRATLPRFNDLPVLAVTPTDPFSFGHYGHAGCFVAAQAVNGDLPGNWRMTGLRELFDLLDDAAFAAAGRALQYAEWDLNHRYCGRCGAATTRAVDAWARICTMCRFAAFPRISPAVIMLIHKGDSCLLAHAAHHPEGMYSVLAGFLEPGETLEECVAREVREEVGIEVTDIRYFGNQPWPFPHSLMLGFTAAWADGVLKPDGSEIIEAGWFTRDTLPERIPSRISIARQLVDHFFASREAPQGGN